MSLQRVPPILQSVAQVRNWVVENVPGTDSMPGYDLFLKLGNDFVSHQVLTLSHLARGLPHPPAVIAEQLQRFEQHGLVTLAADADNGLAVRATERFLGLLDRYGRVFDAMFIVRGELRGQQLLVQSDNTQLADFGRILYDRMYDLGWLYLHNYGSACFLVASLVHRLAGLHGHRARIVSGQVEILNQGNAFMLGAPGYAKPGQIDGHAVCVIDDALMLDFGLGNVRKSYRRDFYWGAIADVRRDGAAFARVVLPDGVVMTWKDDWQSPGSEAELARYAPHLDGLAADYLARFR
ncbi:hypothetical protein QPK32_10910 [Massilia sp. YIM B02763]|uniref:hypothetical protein n=1 Tax=Massilia sp. YIM B02763 TaxID=3050130 RepID=UPI0025B6377B|nr:hypothetical protein [Massilia sp. YIM B02763]MDN4053589.1 hypothetical protein [Massilia sp. YIM B02763]